MKYSMYVAYSLKQCLPLESTHRLIILFWKMSCEVNFLFIHRALHINDSFNGGTPCKSEGCRFKVNCRDEHII